MIPTKQRNGADEKCTKGAIKGPRPSPLKIRENSRPIHKQSSSSSSSSSSNSLQKKHRKKPIIVYARSPKIIHTKAHDFMALVQKLTGLSRDHALQDSSNCEGRYQKQDENSRTTNYCEGIARIDEIKDGHVNATTSLLYSPLFTMPLNPYLADIPLFTPNSADFFCFPRPLFQFSDMMSSLSPNIGNSLSPSFMEAMKGLPEY